MHENGVKRWYFDGSNVHLVQLTALYADEKGPVRGGVELGREYVLAEATDGKATIICILLGEAYEQYDRAEHIQFAAMVLNSLIQVRFRELVYMGKATVEKLKTRTEALSDIEKLLALPNYDKIPVFTIDKYEVVSRLKSSSASDNYWSRQPLVADKLSVKNLLQTSGSGYNEKNNFNNDNKKLFEDQVVKIGRKDRPTSLEYLAGFALSEKFPASSDTSGTGNCISENSENQWWKTDKEDLHFGEESQISFGKKSKKRRRGAKDSQTTLSLPPLASTQKPVVLPVYGSLDETETGSSFGILLEAAEEAHGGELETKNNNNNNINDNSSDSHDDDNEDDNDINDNDDNYINDNDSNEFNDNDILNGCFKRLSKQGYVRSAPGLDYKDDNKTTLLEERVSSTSKASKRKGRAYIYSNKSKHNRDDLGVDGKESNDYEQTRSIKQSGNLYLKENHSQDILDKDTERVPARIYSQAQRVEASESKSVLPEMVTPLKEGRITRSKVRQKSFDNFNAENQNIVQLKFPNRLAGRESEGHDVLEIGIRHNFTRHQQKPLLTSSRPYTISKANFGTHKKFILAYLNHRANEI